MYAFDSRVRYSEIDHQGTMTLPALINYFQDCSTFQSEDIGVGLEVLREKKGMAPFLLAGGDRPLSEDGRADYSRHICHRVQGTIREP